MERK
jgi:hypothetical protein